VSRESEKQKSINRYRRSEQFRESRFSPWGRITKENTGGRERVVDLQKKSGEEKIIDPFLRTVVIEEKKF